MKIIGTLLAFLLLKVTMRHTGPHDMTDKDWMLNPSAIKAAKACIIIVQGELGVKLKLSHPDFVEMLKDYVELTESQDLEDAYHRLIDFAGASARHFKANKTVHASAINHHPPTSPPEKTNNENVKIIDDVEYVVLRNKHYKRFVNGKEFKGLYRGQARYK